MTELLYLDSDDVADLVDVPTVVGAVRDAYRAFGEADRLGSEVKLFRESPDGMLMYYGAILVGAGVMGTFTYWGGFGDDDAWFLTVLADADTGAPLALVDSVGINPYKTGATGAVGVDALARADASVVGIVGTGPQAAAQLLAIATVRDLREVRAFSPTRANREAFADRMADALGVDVVAVDTASAAVRDADVVVTATTAHEPVVDAADIAPGTHVTAMGQSHPTRRELDAATVAKSRYVPDVRAQALEMSGELLGAIAEGAVDESHVHADLGAVLAGTAPGRTDDEQVTVFDMGGTGIETIAAAHLVYERARERGRGTTLRLTPKSEGMRLP
ncbi:ornithine cyclodeaminase family protein [Salinigranum salinum]|uniref:ornithine cyclodeaminase family protein n=1 Tax=Salinigranum salinum TaxID=1364937 RepID=UPI001260EBFE|nr:ornithine cyclodeaminase family protein [Salinigranum salinum]